MSLHLVPSSRFSSAAILPRLNRLRELRIGYHPDDDIVDRYRGDELGFITAGLGQFQEDSWSNWRTILKAAFGVPLTEPELFFFREVAQRDPPPGRVSELWIIGGRRGGKDSVASGIAAQASCYADEGLSLRPGERALVACFATDRDQAGIVHDYIKGYFSTIPSLRRRVVGELPHSYQTPLSLSNRTDIRVVTNNFRAPRGRPIPVAIFDEVAFWRDEKSATPDVETYNAVYPSIRSIPNAMLIAISTAYRQKGMLYTKWKDYFGKNDPRILVVVATTRQLRPTYPQEVIDEALAKDYEANAAEYLSQWRRDLADFVSRDVVDALVDRGIVERSREPGINYVAFCDPSGGSSDSMTLAIAHRDRDGVGILDLIREIRAPFEPEDAVTEFAKTLATYGLKRTTGDYYAAEWNVSAFRRKGIRYDVSESPKKDIYQDFLPLMNSRKVRFLDNPRLVDQLCSLERRTARGGRDSIDHPPKAHDDVANAVAGALVLATAKGSAIERLQRAYG